MPLLILLVLALVFGAMLLYFYVLLLGGVIAVATPLGSAVAVVLGLGYASFRPLLFLTRQDTISAVPLTSPDAVKQGLVLGHGPRGEMAGHGWDRAWPGYFPHQAKRDVVALTAVVTARCTTLLRWPFDTALKLWAKWDGGVAKRLLVAVPIIATFTITVGAWMLVFALSVAAFSGVALGVAWLMLTLGTWTVHLVGTMVGKRDEASRRRQHIEFGCPSCYRKTMNPGRICPSCGEVHRFVFPGPLGIFRRTCGCGADLPTTASKAAALGLETVCPYCDARMGASAGNRPTVLVPIFGSVAAGKTYFLGSLVSGMTRVLADSGGTLVPENKAAQTFASLVDNQSTLPKTPNHGRPEVMLFEATSGSTVHEIQLVDAAGEKFANWESTRDLTYIDDSNQWVYVLDALTLSGVRDALGLAGVPLDSVPVATGSASDAYGSVVDRMRSAGADLADKAIAIVVSKADVVSTVPGWQSLGESSDGVRDFLYDNGADDLVRRVSNDFRTVNYFAVAPLPASTLTPRDPLKVIDWVLATKGMRLRFLPASDGSSRGTPPVDVKDQEMSQPATDTNEGVTP